MNLPNKLTLIRIALVPLLVASFYLPEGIYRYAAAAVFIVAYSTDILDGYIARKRHLITNFGKLIDPIADKLVTGTVLIMMAAFELISPLIACIIIAREFIISGLRSISAGNGVVIAAGTLGKLKTVTQCVGIVLVLLGNPIFNRMGVPFDQIILWLSVGLTIWSGADYIVKNLKHIDLN